MWLGGFWGEENHQSLRVFPQIQGIPTLSDPGVLGLQILPGFLEFQSKNTRDILGFGSPAQIPTGLALREDTLYLGSGCSVAPLGTSLGGKYSWRGSRGLAQG